MTSPTVHDSGAGVQAGALYRFALRADASTLPTGIQPWEMTIVQRYSDRLPRMDVKQVG